MTDARALFRQAALDRLSSPDQLDQLVPVTTPARWIALAGFSVLTAAALVWSVTAEVPTRVEGRGILLARGGSIADAMAVASGTLARVAVEVGASVTKDQVLAEIAQPGLQRSVDDARMQADELAAEQDRLRQQVATETTLQRGVLARLRAAQQTIIDGQAQRSAYYLQTMRDLGNQVEHGDITRQRLQDARQEWQSAEQEAKRGAAELVRIDAGELDDANRHQDDLTRAAMRLSEARRRLAELEGQLSVATRVLAPASGTVTEVKAQGGAYVPAGTPLVSIQSGTAGLEYVLYIPLDHGKEIKPGMAVQIEPATVRKEEFGTMQGTVVSVSDFPASAQGMMAVLQNGDLVRQFSTPAPPYAARVALLTREGEPGRPVWSSGSGPPLAITSGTLAQAEITVRRQRPITLVLPALDQVFGWSP